MVVCCKKESVSRWDVVVMYCVWRGCDKVWIGLVEFLLDAGYYSVLRMLSIQASKSSSGWCVADGARYGIGFPGRK